MKIFFVLLLLASVPLGSWVKRERTSSPYQFSKHITQAFESDTTRGGNQLTATAFSFIGEYGQALAYFDKGDSQTWYFSGKDSLYLRSFAPHSARAYIVERAKKERIIIINEAHHKPLHRVFTASLLADLYRLGFRYLGAETLSHYDPGLNQRTYPVQESGYYTAEPQYGNLIREALELGFTVFPYEAPVSNPKEREIGQARRIQGILRQDPKAKILLHCGYAHVHEAPLGGDWEKAMAGRLKEFTGIDPFTIDQERWTENSEPTRENPAYRLLQVTQPSVLLNGRGEVFTAFPGTQALTDIRVAHPRTSYRHGRPAWLLREGKWKPYFLKREQLTLGFPCLVRAYRASEPAEGLATSSPAVPVDVMELKGAGEQKALVLPPGAYQVVVEHEGGQKQTFRIFH
jgi:hypothetical protein